VPRCGERGITGITVIARAPYVVPVRNPAILPISPRPECAGAR
jgi:hypothetical protein